MAKIVLFGAPGAGKGTLAERIKKISPVVHISTGDLFRYNMKEGTPIGKEAKEYINAGKLVPDSVVIGMVKDRINQDDVASNGFMLDGFPRTLNQAKALSQVAQLDKVVVLDIDKEVLKKRILGRWSCPKCNKIYNIYNKSMKPKIEGKCDKCADTELTHRSDDNEETFNQRWQTYLSQSEEVIDYYDQTADLLTRIDGEKTLIYTEDELKQMIDL